MLGIFNTLKPFFKDNYKRIGVREYSRLQKISPPNASKILQKLKEEGLLEMEEERKNHLYFTKRNNLFIKLQQIYYQEELKSLWEYLNKELINPTIILFGSFAKAEINEKSDIDIAIFTISNKQIELKKFEKKFNREIQIFYFKDKESLKDNPELLNNILNGTIISGGW